MRKDGGSTVVLNRGVPNVCSFPETQGQVREGEDRGQRETKIKWTKETERNRYQHRSERSML